jgi:hypothetical protein
VIHCDFLNNAHLDVGVFTMNMQETALVIYSKYFKRTLLSDAACWSTRSESKNTVKISRNRDLEINVCKQMQNEI